MTIGTVVLGETITVPQLQSMAQIADDYAVFKAAGGTLGGFLAGTPLSTGVVTPTGATASAAVADLHARHVFVEDFNTDATAFVHAIPNAGSTAFPTGTDAGPAIQAAINSLGSQGGIVHFGPYNYLMRTTVLVNSSAIHFRGQGFTERAGPAGGTFICQDQIPTGPTLASFTAAISGTTLTVSAVASGVLTVGAVVQGFGIAAGTIITGFGTGTGGAGTYTLGLASIVYWGSVTTGQAVAPAQTVSATAMTTITGNLFQVCSPVAGSDNPRGSSFRHMGFFQVQPASAAGWMPNPWPHVIGAYNMTGGVIFDDLFFCGVTNAINLDFVGHWEVVGTVKGQFFTNAITNTNCQDTPIITGLLRHWGYRASIDHNIQNWQRLNCDVLLIGKVDGILVDKLFGFGARSVVHGFQEPTIASPQAAVNYRVGGAPQIACANFQSDHCSWPVWLDNIYGSGSPMVWHFGELIADCVGTISAPDGSGHQADTIAPIGNFPIWIDNCREYLEFVADNARLEYAPGEAVNISGTTCVVSFGALRCGGLNQAYNTPQSAVVVGDNATGGGGPNEVSFGTPPHIFDAVGGLVQCLGSAVTSYTAWYAGGNPAPNYTKVAQVSTWAAGAEQIRAEASGALLLTDGVPAQRVLRGPNGGTTDLLLILDGNFIHLAGEGSSGTYTVQVDTNFKAVGPAEFDGQITANAGAILNGPIYLGGTTQLVPYTYANLPSAATNPQSVVWCSNARIAGQAAGAGTGAMVMTSGGAWVMMSGAAITT